MSMTQGSFAEVLLLELECNRDSPAPESRQEDGIHATGMAHCQTPMRYCYISMTANVNPNRLLLVGHFEFDLLLQGPRGARFHEAL